MIFIYGTIFISSFAFDLIYVCVPMFTITSSFYSDNFH